jgi:hypothetical protein
MLAIVIGMTFPLLQRLASELQQRGHGRASATGAAAVAGLLTLVAAAMLLRLLIPLSRFFAVLTRETDTIVWGCLLATVVWVVAAGAVAVAIVALFLRL